MKLRDRELELDIAAVAAQHAEAKAQELRAMERQTADLKPIRSRIEAIEKQRRRLEEQQAALIVRAPHGGRWVAPDAKDYVGAWLARGTPLGQIVNPQSFHFSAIVTQQEASRLFADEIRMAEVRLFGQSGIPVAVTDRKIIPADRDTLPSAALGWRGGGEVATAPTDASGVRASEPFFELHATVKPEGDALILHGRSGKIRFSLPAEPLLRQWIRKLRQLLQKRYAL